MIGFGKVGCHSAPIMTIIYKKTLRASRVFVKKAFDLLIFSPAERRNPQLLI